MEEEVEEEVRRAWVETEESCLRSGFSLGTEVLGIRTPVSSRPTDYLHPAPGEVQLHNSCIPLSHSGSLFF